MVTDRFGKWGEYDSAFAGPVFEIVHEDRLIGYCSNVNPEGFVITSLRKELAPVKFYSTSGLYVQNVEDDDQDLIRSLLLRVIDDIESKSGSVITLKSDELEKMVFRDFKPSWDLILNYTPGTLDDKGGVKTTSGNYQMGDILVDARWYQGAPYNNWCPPMGCTTTSNGNAVVGCTALASAQIMKYWCWPPYGIGSGWDNPYNWLNMPDVATTDSTIMEQNAVAEICSEVGLAQGMEYGCDLSAIYERDNVSIAFEDHFRYKTNINIVERHVYDAVDWFNLIKYQINLNRPVQYYVITHQIVCDGWIELVPGNMMYHMNYGWGPNSPYTMWYCMDGLYKGDFDEEYMYLDIVPTGRIGAVINGSYGYLGFPYRYFDVDASGSGTFNGGMQLQTLPGITITGSGSNTYLAFLSASGQTTRIFTKGDDSRGIAIYEGSIRLKNDGSLKLPKQ
jgi:hypothetical protein